MPFGPVVGSARLRGGLVAMALFAFLSTGATSIGPAGGPQLVDPADVPVPYRDAEAKVSLFPPPGWLVAPSASLDRVSDDQLYEVARFQLRLRDAGLYGQPLPVTSGLLADAGAVLSIALARQGSALIGADLALIAPDAVQRLPGATAVDGETSYDGVVTLTRLIVARDTGRTAVVRGYVPTADRGALAETLLAAIASASIDPAGPNGPVYVAPAPPSPPAPAPEAAAPPPDPSAALRAEIVTRAALLLGTPYVWGGNVAGRGMDCSAYVSAAWGVARYTTDSIWNVAAPVAKEDLLPGDAMDLETWRDPARYGHIRLFDAWANAAHTLVWVYEETPPRAIHRVIAYDDRYRPMRLSGLSPDGVAPLIPAPAPDPAPRFQPPPARPRSTPVPARRPTPTPTPRPLLTPRPALTPRVTATPRLTATSRPTTTVAPLATPRPTPRPSASPTHR